MTANVSAPAAQATLRPLRYCWTGSSARVAPTPDAYELTRAIRQREAASGQASILADFLTSIHSDIDALRAAASAGDADAVGRHTHRVHGASLAVAARRMAQVAAGIEACANAGVPPDESDRTAGRGGKSARRVGRTRST